MIFNIGIIILIELSIIIYLFDKIELELESKNIEKSHFMSLMLSM